MDNDTPAAPDAPPFAAVRALVVTQDRPGFVSGAVVIAPDAMTLAALEGAWRPARRDDLAIAGLTLAHPALFADLEA